MKPDPNALVEESYERVAGAAAPEFLFVLTASETMPLFADHFPGSPLLPAFSQMGELVTRAQRAWPDLGQWAGASNIKFKAPIRPGSRVHMRLTRSGSRTVTFAMSVEDALCTSGSLGFRGDDGAEEPA